MMLVSLALILLVSVSEIAAHEQDTYNSRYGNNNIGNEQEIYYREDMSEYESDDTNVEAIQLRVMIFPYIPDLNNDTLRSLTQFIKQSFEEQHKGITLVVDADKDPYQISNMWKYLGTSADAYDVAEVDMILLGEMVQSNLLQPNPNPDIDIKDGSFLPFAASAVRYKGQVYGIPTLVCSNFLASMTSSTGHGDVPLIGSFRGSWTLPGYYLNAYINKYGAFSLDEGVISNPLKNGDVMNDVKQFSDTCKRSDGTNRCTDGTYRDTKAMINDAVSSKTSKFLAYSEVIGQALYQNPGLSVGPVGVPRIGNAKYLPMFTDALVANKNTYLAKQDAIKKFMSFYSSVQFRYLYAYCADMDFRCIRYVLPARTEFYDLPKVKPNAFYQNLRNLFNKHGTTGPNNQFYCTKDDLNRAISIALNYP